MRALVGRQRLTDLGFFAQATSHGFFRRIAPSKSWFSLGCLTLLALAQPAHAQRIEWSVDNPYPLFRDTADWNRLKPTATETSDFQIWMSRLFSDASRERTLWPVATQWDAAAERFDPDYFSDRIAITARLADAPSGMCHWSLTAAPQPCNAPVSGFVVPNQPITVSVAATGGVNIEPITIHVQREIILGLGDSYSSGEGNPDRPIHFAKTDLNGKGARWYASATDTAKGFEKAEWLDEQCHRSLYSYQNLTAMWRAAQDPHKAVYFVPLACSGAEIGDGVLSAQKKPPGGDRKTNRYSQLDAAAQVLVCKDKECRYPPDILLLSIGGNDAYFANLIKSALVPKRGWNSVGSVGMALLRSQLGLKDVLGDSNYKIRNELGSDIQGMLRKFHAAGLLEKQPQLAVTDYPDPLYRENGKDRCSMECIPGKNGTPYSGSDWKSPERKANDDNQCRSSINHALNHLIPFASNWQLRITSAPKGMSKQESQYEQELLEKNVLDILGERLKDAYDTSNLRPNFVLHWVEAPATVQRHGICAVEERNSKYPRRELDWPWVDAHGEWPDALSPYTWLPYQRRQRWFRTPNDTYLTQANPSGAYHPSAEYHAAMAKEVICALDGRPPQEQCK